MATSFRKYSSKMQFGLAVKEYPWFMMFHFRGRYICRKINVMPSVWQHYRRTVVYHVDAQRTDTTVRWTLHIMTVGVTTMPPAAVAQPRTRLSAPTR